MEKLRGMYHGQQGRVFQWHADTVQKHVHTICKAGGITDTTVHGLRHANAAIMILLNVVDQYAMAKWMD